MESAIVPRHLRSLARRRGHARRHRGGVRLTRRLAVEQGLLVGISSGAAPSAALKIAARLDAGVVVTIFSDGGEKYLSERFWEEPAEGSIVGGVN